MREDRATSVHEENVGGSIDKMLCVAVVLNDFAT